MLRLGIGVKEKDIEKALTYYLKAAESNIDAQYQLGTLYFEEFYYVPSKNNEIIRLYEAAANQGHEKAIFNLATINLNGLLGVEKNYQKAKELFQKLPNNKDAVYELAKLHLSSDIVQHGLNIDIRKAKELFENSNSQ